MSSRSSTKGFVEELLVIDYSPTAVAFERHLVRYGDVELAESAFPLQLPSSAETKRVNSSRGIISAVRELLTDLAHRGRLKNTAILIGHQSDPFFPFHGKCDLTLKILQTIAEFSFARFNIQTRSPFVLLAVPLLKAFKAETTVTFAVETFSDSEHFACTPRLPRTSERIRTAQTLRGADIFVCVQAAPLTSVHNLPEEIDHYAAQLQSAADRIRICDINDIREAMPANNSSQAALNELPGALAREALEKVLGKLSPEKLINCTESAENAAIRA